MSPSKDGTGTKGSRATGSRGSVSRRELAVARVLDPARERAEGKVKAFLDAALELVNSDSGQDFTVQEVIERSGQSLRSFYQHFDGKYELLLALFEDAVHTAAIDLRAVVAESSSPIDGLHRFAVEYFHVCQPSPKARTQKKGFAPAFANFAQQLLTEHPQEASHAFVPVTEIVVDLLDRAAAAGQIRSGLRHARIAGVVLQAIMFNAFAATIGGVPVQAGEVDPAEELWDLLVNGIRK
ncbi:MAG TPA: TetR/AcrR family transcriptional regulator [Mycobacteriales bacterium]|nr:TetR/AcrR family transcriptional regulator [Mycobacteriales bacterium]